MAQRRSHVPKFGNWDTDHMPYTAVFDNARHGRGRPINPNDPSENPGAFEGGRGNAAPGRRSFNPNDPEDAMDDPDPERPTEVGSREGNSRGHADGGSKDGSSRGLTEGGKDGSSRGLTEGGKDGSSRGHTEGSKDGSSRGLTEGGKDGSSRGLTEGGKDGSSRGHTEGSKDGSSRGERQQQIAAGAAARRAAAGPAHGNGIPSRVPAVDPKRPSRDNSHDRSVESPSTSFSAEHSPAHLSAHPRGTRLGAASPAWERRRNSTGEDAPAFAPATPNRSRLRPGSNSNKDDHSNKLSSAALPKFGEWDAQDLGSGDGFTVIFNNAINEKKAGVPVSIPRTPDHKNADLYESTGDFNKGHNSRRSWFCCGAPRVKA